jgi:hypothetical protein
MELPTLPKQSATPSCRSTIEHSGIGTMIVIAHHVTCRRRTP